MSACNPLNVTGTNYSNACLYVRNYAGCQLGGGFINYYQWQYCAFNNRVVPSILMILWFLVLLLTIAITADCFFAPCLVAIAKFLRMSQNLAGVTILGLGNGASDVFTTLSAILSQSTPNFGLAFGDILGAGVFVNTITAGIIMILFPFNVMQRPVMKDLSFYFLGLLWCMMIMIRRQIELWSSIVFLIGYVVYILVTVISRLIFTRNKKNTPSLEIPIPNMDNIEITVTNMDDNRDPADLESTIDGRLPPIVGQEIEIDMGDSSLECFTVPRSPYPQRSNSGRIKIEINHGHDNLAVMKDKSSDFLSVPGAHQRKRSSSGNIKIERNRSYDNPAYVSENTGDFLKINFDNESFHNLSDMDRRMSEKSSIDERPAKSNFSKKQMHSVERISMKSYRSIASTVKMVIENEHKKELMRKKSSAEVIRIIQRRAASFNESMFTSMEPKAKIRFYSMSEDGKNKKDVKPGDEELTQISNINAQNNDLNVDECEVVKFPGAFKHFLLTILPFDLEEWKDQSILLKILIVCRSPILFILTFSIPVIDETAYLKGWCKILNCMHCIICPIVCVIYSKGFTVNIGNSTFNVTYLLLIIGIILCIVVAATSRADTDPIYHIMFAFIGFITAILWLYEIANEIVNVLTVFGVLLEISSTILGLSVLAAANSIQDLVSDITIAKKGYPRIGYSACIGSPLFNLYVGIGLSFTIKTISGPVVILLRPELIFLMFTILMVTAINIISIPLMKFQLARNYGIMLIVLYFVYLILAILFATNTIPVQI